MPDMPGQYEANPRAGNYIYGTSGGVAGGADPGVYDGLFSWIGRIWDQGVEIAQDVVNLTEGEPERYQGRYNPTQRPGYPNPWADVPGGTTSGLGNFNFTPTTALLIGAGVLAVVLLVKD